MTKLSVSEAINEKILDILSDSDILFHVKIPVQSHVVKKNNRPIFKNKKTGKGIIGKSKELQASEKMYGLHFQNIKNRIGMKSPLSCRLWAIFLFHFEWSKYFTKKGSINKNLPDLSNLYELPQDCLTDAGIIEDDGLIDSHDCSRRLPSKETFLEIFLLKYPGHEPNKIMGLD